MDMKDDIRRRLTLSRYPRRRDATFSDENGHNPAVLQDCARCHGRGKHCEDVDGAAVLDTCRACDGAGITGETEPYFANDEPELVVALGADGWITCPACDYRFAPTDRNAWTGRRHIRCGQQLRIGT